MNSPMSSIIGENFKYNSKEHEPIEFGVVKCTTETDERFYAKRAQNRYHTQWVDHFVLSATKNFVRGPETYIGDPKNYGIYLPHPNEVTLFSRDMTRSYRKKGGILKNKLFVTLDQFKENAFKILGKPINLTARQQKAFKISLAKLAIVIFVFRLTDVRYNGGNVGLVLDKSSGDLKVGLIDVMAPLHLGHEGLPDYNASLFNFPSSKGDLILQLNEIISIIIKKCAFLQDELTEEDYAAGLMAMEFSRRREYSHRCYWVTTENDEFSSFDEVIQHAQEDVNDFIQSSAVFGDEASRGTFINEINGYAVSIKERFEALQSLMPTTDVRTLKFNIILKSLLLIVTMFIAFILTRMLL